MDRLPNELVAQIASNTDNTTLLAFATTSRHLHEGSFPVYGARLITTLKFCLHTISLQALDISRKPYIAKYVRNVGFGPEDVGVVAPSHLHNPEDESLHSAVPLATIPSAEQPHLSSAGTRTDSAVMSQALVRFPKVDMIMVGERDALEGAETRPSIGKIGLFRFSCSCSHCWNLKWTRSAYSVYLTTASAIAQMGKSFSHIKISISLAHSDYSRARAQPLVMNWHVDEDVTRRTTNEKLTKI
jgi:hypothetical protein